MTKFPDIRHLLPSAAKRAIRDYLVERLLAAGLNPKGDSLYRLPDALSDAAGQDPPAQRWVIETFSDAKDVFEQTYPLAWTQQADGSYKPTRSRK